VTGSRHDRFGAVLVAGQRITQARLADDIRAALCEGARSLLEAERCSIIDRGEGEGDAPLVAAALRSGHLVVWPSDDGTISGPAGARCALCAPIPVSGRPAAVLYATHSTDAAFGDDARAIVGFLVGLASAALEGAAARVRAEELDRRVQAQAAELAAAQHALDDNRRQLTALRKQLLHAGRMAAVGTLFAGLTHELNNPLSVIVGNVDNLRNLAPAGEPIARVIDAIDRQATRATRLVSALLRFSRTGPGAAEEVPPDELIRLVVDLLAAEARRREIALRVSVADGLNPLFVVRHEIESALVNITTNALQATPEGGVVELLVFAESRDAVPGVRFVARDTGVGIAPEILPQIFDPFFTTKPEGEGTGLGLSLAREIAISHGGQLTVESVVGHGTTMSLWLPERVSPARSRRSPTG
jgi:signal transduction histidine kinase